MIGTPRSNRHRVLAQNNPIVWFPIGGQKKKTRRSPWLGERVKVDDHVANGPIPNPKSQEVAGGRRVAQSIGGGAISA